MGRAVSVWGDIPRVEARPSVDGRVRGMGARSLGKSAGARGPRLDPSAASDIIACGGRTKEFLCDRWLDSLWAARSGLR